MQVDADMCLITFLVGSMVSLRTGLLCASLLAFMGDGWMLQGLSKIMIAD